MMIKKIGIISDVRMLKHKSKKKHPQSPARLAAIIKKIEEKEYFNHPRIDYISQYERFATNQELALVYPQKYISYIEQLWPKATHRTDLTVLDTYFNQHSEKISRLSAGGVLQGIDHIMTGKWDHGFSIIRPPGHHSGAKNTINGFCIFNNIAIGAKYLQKKYNLKKIAILDYDIHQGDGTHHIFKEDQSVLFISIHRYDRGTYYPSGEGGNYPNCGEGPAEGTNINIPLNFVKPNYHQYGFQAPGDNEYVYIYNKIVDPVLRQFDPDFILVSSGFDAARHDPLGGFTVTPNGYYYITKKLIEMKKPVLCVLQGGYNLQQTAKASLAVVKGLLDEQSLPQPKNKCEYQNLGDLCHLQQQYHDHIDQIVVFLSTYWKSLMTEKQINYTKAIKNNKEKLFGIVGDEESSSSSDQKQDEATKQQNSSKVNTNKNQLQIFNHESQSQQGTTQFYFAAGHMQRFKNFGIKNDRFMKWVYPNELKFFESNFPEGEFASKFYGTEGQYAIIENALYEQEEHVVLDIKLGRKSKYPYKEQQKKEKELKNQKSSTSSQYGFRIGGFTTPDYKQGSLLISDLATNKRLLAKVVKASNKELFCNFITKMIETLKTVKRQYFGTSILLVSGKEKSNIKWIDFHYWLDNCQTYDQDVVEGLENLRKFILEIQTDK